MAELSGSFAAHSFTSSEAPTWVVAGLGAGFAAFWEWFIVQIPANMATKVINAIRMTSFCLFMVNSIAPIIPARAKLGLCKLGRVAIAPLYC